jgi:hypothetical protein
MTNIATLVILLLLLLLRNHSLMAIITTVITPFKEVLPASQQLRKIITIRQAGSRDSKN